MTKFLSVLFFFVGFFFSFRTVFYLLGGCVLSFARYSSSDIVCVSSSPVFFWYSLAFWGFISIFLMTVGIVSFMKGCRKKM